MSQFQPIKRAPGSTPGAITPASWNQVRQTLIELDARLRRLQPQSSPDVKIRQNQTGFTAWTTRRPTAGDTIHHPWKVTEGTPETASEGEGTTTTHKWDLIGGLLFGQYGDAQPIIVPDQTVSAPPDVTTGYIVLRIERHEATREIIAAVPQFHQILIDTLEEYPYTEYEVFEQDTYQYQYRNLAKVTAGTPVLQLQFEELRLWEELIVLNGAFSFLTYEISTRNSYDLPPPPTPP